MLRIRLGWTLALSLLMALPTTAAHADAGTATTSLELSGPARVQRTGSATLTATLSSTDPAVVVSGAAITFQRSTTNGWQDLGTASTDDTGTAAFTAPVPASSNSYRAAWAGPSGQVLSEPIAITGFRRHTTLRLTGRWHLVDGHRRTLTLRWRAGNGAPVPGTVEVYRRVGKHGHWKRARTRHLGADGVAHLRVGPRRDTWWKAVGARGPWWKRDRTKAHFLDNRPPGIPVQYPRHAPRPKKLPAQRHAVGKGPHPVISRIPDKVWRSMTGRSWHRGCPVGRSQLRLLRINYWDFDGYRRRGVMVLRDHAVHRAAGALAEMYRRKFPLRAMYRVDRFGWSRYLHGADDYASMRHDNSSAFNCRGVTGNPRVLSPHSYGTAVDLNTWENPYHSARGIVPNRWWAHHSAPRITWRSHSSPVVRIWRRHGFHWTYANADSQHFDGRRSGPTGVEGSFVAD